MLRRSLLTAVALAMLGGASSLAQNAAPVQAQDVWARATPKGASTGAIYLTLTSPAGDALIGVSTPAASHAGVHEMSMQGNVMRMRSLEGGLDLPAGKPVTLGPGGYHIMLEGLKAPLQVGQTVPVHLTFRSAPPVDVQAQVQSMGATSPHGGAMPGMTMGK